MIRSLGEIAQHGRAMLGLFFIQRYCYLSTEQYARITGFELSQAVETLLNLERRMFIGRLSNLKLINVGQPRDVYFLKESSCLMKMILTVLSKALARKKVKRHVQTS